VVLEFRILGPLEILRDGEAIRLGGRKQRSIAALFVLHAGEFLSSDRLIEELWEGYDDGAPARLQVHISQFRKALGEDAGVLETRPGGYALAAGPDAVDAARFERLTREGRDALAAGDARTAARTLREALALWRGPALGDLAFEPVGERAAARLEELRLAAQEDRIEADLALGRDQELVAELEDLVAAHPLREQPRAQLILALYRCGRQADALRAYSDARTELADEGLEPGPELAALQMAVLRQDPALLIDHDEAERRRQPAASASDALAGVVEREAFLQTLEDYLGEARAGHGRLVFMGGEAGVGKTTLLQRFADAHRGSVRVLVGAADGTATPQPLGPLFEMLPELREEWGDHGAGEVSRQQLFDGVLASVAGGDGPTVLVFEDVHWADEATFDLLRYLGRRVIEVPAMVLASYRDDEIGRGHPLTLVLGDAATYASTRRMTLPRLSEDGVATLARDSGIDAGELHALTGGNAFFVTEVLAAASAAPDGGGVPATVRDAVLARAARLSDPARSALDAASVIGRRSEPWLLERVLEGGAGPVEECVERGMLRVEDGLLAFRHEMARRAVEDHVPAIRRIELHRAVLAALVEHGWGEDDAARLAHHAEAAGDGASVLVYAPVAALRAKQLGAHREAAAQYGRAARFAGPLPEERRADLLERVAFELYLTDQVPEAVEARRKALAAWRWLGRKDKVGENLRWLSRLAWFEGRNAEAEEHAAESVRVLESLPPGRELAFAYSNVAQLRMLSQDLDAAVEWGERAIALAEEIGEAEVLAHALTNVGTALLFAERVDEGTEILERGLQLARDHDFHDHAARAYTNLGSSFLMIRRYREADAYLSAGLEWCRERDLDSMEAYLVGGLARSQFEQGRWDAAMATSRSILRHARVMPISGVAPLIVVGLIRARRGIGDPWPPLDEALALSQPTGELQRLGIVSAARAEAAWLQGEPAREAALLSRTLDMALATESSWSIGQVAFWLWRAGGLDSPPDGACEPFALQMAGRWVEAADRWLQLGCPYERATALAEADDEPSVRDGLDMLNAMEATPAARRAAERLRELTASRETAAP
jgi:DNA-binding SARP family transcriptional activator